MPTGGGKLFEGPEKKLAVVLRAPMPGFRSGASQRWRKVVAASGAEIISRIGNRSMDAYLLSESSLFVWSDRLLLITCGQTSPLDALPVLLDEIPVHLIGSVFYVRKNFLFPQRQQSDFEAEVAAILPFFPGKSYRLGPANDDHLHLFYAIPAPARFQKTQTIALHMRGLPRDTISAFRSDNASAVRNTPSLAQLGDMCKGMMRDDHFFSPDGYSLNAIRGERYFTVHVTPQQPGSYASVETNIVSSTIPGTIHAMLNLFRPERFTLALTTTMNRSTRSAHRRLDMAGTPYTMVERSRYELDCGHIVSVVNGRRTDNR